MRPNQQCNNFITFILVNLQKKDLYYPYDYTRRGFQRPIALVGLRKFKLTGFKELHKLSFNHIAYSGAI